GERPRHARAVHPGGARAEDKTDAAKHRKAARDRHSATGAALPHGASARCRIAPEAIDVLQRFAAWCNRSAGRGAHDLRDAVDAECRGARRPDLRAAAYRRTAAEPD